MVRFFIRNCKKLFYSVLFFSLLFLHMAFLQVNGVYTQAESISDSVLRLRILANSDEAWDQALKLKLKTEICNMLQPWLEKYDSKEEAVEWITQHMDWIRQQTGVLLEQLLSEQMLSQQPLSQQVPSQQTLSQQVLSQQTLSQQAFLTDFLSANKVVTVHDRFPALPQYDVQLTSSLFPTRTYGNLTFPPGHYDTLLITLGEGNGHNWWCVLYPSLCFLDETCADFPEESKNQLQDALSEADYEALQEGVTFRFRIAEILGSLYEKLHSACITQKHTPLSP